MNWKVWMIAVLVVLTAGWMLFDGTRALLLGDFVTPLSGEHAGQLGPWADLLTAAGIEPRSTFVKLVFVAYGLAALVALTGYLTGQHWGRNSLAAISVLGLWYLPFGTVANLIVLVLLYFTRS